MVFGAVPPGQAPAWDERVTAALDKLSFGYAAVLATAVASLLVQLNGRASNSVDTVGWIFSLWATMLFATCVAHDLLHRRSKAARMLGHVLAGFSGYPLLGYEHNRHHNLPGNTAAAEWPLQDESVWRFGLRRMLVIADETLGRRGILLSGDSRSAAVRGMRLSTLTTSTALGTFGLAAGWRGVIIYAASCVLVVFSVQVVTYVQHWALGDDSCTDAKARGYGWESDCRFEAWVTMGLSLHYTHHQQGPLPYYRINLASDSPRLPMGYVVLMFVSFVPSLWRRVMTPALNYWRSHPSSPLPGSRSISCVGLYR
nr:fatty acid desaturase [Schlegelella koreensis]